MTFKEAFRATDEDVEAAEELKRLFAFYARKYAPDIAVVAAVWFAAELYLSSNFPNNTPERFAKIARAAAGTNRDASQ